MKIHFVAFFGVEFDLDILPYWSKYYLDRHFDSYKIFLHRETGDIGNSLKNEFKHLGFSIETASGAYGHGTLQKLHIDNYVSTLPEDDFIVVADADEFQSMPDEKPVRGTVMMYDSEHCIGPEMPSPLDYRKLLAKYDLLTGYMVDRYNFKMDACFSDPFLQYPYEEPFTRDILKNYTPPFLRKSAWPHTRRTKILAARAGAEVAYAGSHCLLTIQSAAKILVDFRVMHFAWRDSTKLKVLNKAYYSRDNVNEIYDNKIRQELLLRRLTPENVPALLGMPL